MASKSDDVRQLIVRAESVARRACSSRFGFWLVVGLLTIFAMPVFGIQPVRGLDEGWAAGMYLAQREGLRFGKDIVFTYGPLGWLSTPRMFVPSLGVIAALARFVLLGSAVALFLDRFRLKFPVLVAVPLAYLASVLSAGLFVVGGDAVVLVLLLGTGVAVGVLSGEVEQKRWWVVAAGSASAFLLLWKFDAGIEALVFSLGGLCLAELRRSIEREHFNGWRSVVRGCLAPMIRSVVEVLIGFVVAFTLLWSAMGQRFGDVPDWLRWSWQVTIGYSDNLVWTNTSWWELPALLAMIVGLIWLSAPVWRKRPEVFVFVAAALWVIGKQAFTRHDPGHAFRFWAAVVFFALFVGFTTKRMVVVVSAALLAGAVLMPVVRPSWNRPRAGLSMSKNLLGIPLSAKRRVLDPNWVLKFEAIPQSMRDKLRGKTLHVEPQEAQLAGAIAGAIWRPLPVFQSHSVHSVDLDNLNAAFYDSDRAPEYVLVEADSVDNRIPRFESPQAMVRFVCRYEIDETHWRWQLFRRRASDACSTPEILASVRAREGDFVSIPSVPPDKVLVVGVDGTEATAPEKLRSLLLKPSEWWVHLSVEDIPHRFPPGTATQWHLVQLPICLHGTTGSFDTRTYERLGVSRSSVAGESTNRVLTYRFAMVAFDCPAQ